MKPRYPQAKHIGGAWTLEHNGVWNIPNDVHEVHGEMETVGMWQLVRKYRALAKDQDGYIYGVRSLDEPKESGYVLEGKVSIDGHRYRAFTSSTLFQRTDGSLCDVAILYVCNGAPPIPIPNLDTAPDDVLEELTHKYHYAFHGTGPGYFGRNRPMSARACIYEYARITLGLRHGWDEQYPHVKYPERREEVYEQLPEWAKFREVYNEMPN
jgi:hypothetical protein